MGERWAAIGSGRLVPSWAAHYYRRVSPAAEWSDLAWPEAAALDRTRAVAILPLGAVEAHGPHLPLGTDGAIAGAMAASAAARLADRGLLPLLLPPLPYAAAPFASGFAGTLSVGAETVTALVVEVARALAGQGIRLLALANAHLDPAHLASLHAAAAAIRQERLLAVAFPDLTARPWGSRLSDEFRSGACHAGRFESSVVLAVAPGLVREELRRALPANPISLSRAIRAGVASFEAAGGPEAYFGDPAAASATEGEATVELLGGILEDAVVAELETARGAAEGA